MLTDMALLIHKQQIPTAVAILRALGASAAGEDVILPSGQIVQVLAADRYEPTRTTIGIDLSDLPAVLHRLHDLGVDAEPVVPGVVSVRLSPAIRLTVRQARG